MQSYISLKTKLYTFLPRCIYVSLIHIWRNSYVKLLLLKRKYILKNFHSPFFKKIHINKKLGFYLKISPRNGYIDETIYINGIYEKSIYLLMIKHINDGDVCIDIGANIGMYTNFLPKIVGTSGKVIGFEPLQKIYDQNIESIKKNNYSNVYLYNYALSDKTTNLNIHISDSNIGGSSIICKEGRNRIEEIKAITGDSILLKESRINFIKIDTEGYELKVLEGILGTIKKFTPKIILEFSPELFPEKSDGDKILNILTGYYKNILIIETNQFLNGNNQDDIKKLYNLVHEKQVNLFFTP